MSLIHFTPTIDELLPSFEIHCTQIDCKSTFTNSCNFDLHLLRHHNVQPMRRAADVANFYHCPVENCIYNVQEPGGKHFLNLRYVRQHFRKVHATKNFKCNACQKSLLTEKQLQKHQLNACGKTFSCQQCNWQYSSMEALMTHGKRKNHQVKLQLEKITKLPIPRLPKKCAPKKCKKIRHKHQCTQTETEIISNAADELTTLTDFDLSEILPQDMLCAATQTSFLTDFDVEAEINYILRDMETQTERTVINDHVDNDSDNINNNIVNAMPTDDDELHAADFLADMLVNSTNTHTQTCDDIFSDLGLIDIETQTYWPDNALDSVDTLPMSADEIDMLFVSTETQTSFTQCLLDAATCTNDSETTTLYGPPNAGAFHQLHTSQCTQTCDTLHDRLIGGADRTDFMIEQMQPRLPSNF